MTSFDAIPETALDWVQSGRKVAIATVVETWGSAPRPVGAQLLISQEAEIEGSVSGGCVEAAVVHEALQSLTDGKVRIVSYGVSDEEAFAVGLACGGTIRIMVEPVGLGQGPAREDLERLVAARRARQAVVMAVNTEGWQRFLGHGTDDRLAPEIRERLRSDKSGFEDNWFLAVHNPPLKLVIIGAVHIAQPLIGMARLAGYDPVLVDPRDAFASDERFPGETIHRDWPDEVLRGLTLDARTAVVALSHDPKIDDPALIEALSTPVFYIGALGSRRTHAKRVTRLKKAGMPDDQITRIHAPIGLDIIARSPAEIAVSIIAEMTLCLRRPKDAATSD